MKFSLPRRLLPTSLVLLAACAATAAPVKLPIRASLWKKIPGMEFRDNNETTDILIRGSACQTKRIDLPPGTVLLRLQMSMQCFEVVPGKESWQNARMAMSFHDRTGKRVGKWPDVFQGRGNTGKQVCLRDFPVPEQAAYLLLSPANYGTSGRVEFREVSLLALTESDLKEEKRVQPWKNADFSNGLDGWVISGNRNAFSIENHSLVCTPGTPEKYIIGQRQVLEGGKCCNLIADITSDAPADLEVRISSIRYSRPLVMRNPLAIAKGRHRYVLTLEALPYTAARPGDLELEVKAKDRIVFHKLQLLPCDYTRKVLPFSKNWTVFPGIGEEPPAADRIPQQLRDSKGEGILPRKMILPVGLQEKGRTVDFKWIMRNTPGSGGTAVMYNEFVSEEETIVNFGCSADWYYKLWLNGIPVCDRLKDGNRIQDFTPNANRVYLPVKKGRNLFVALIRCGSNGWKFNWGVPLAPKPPLFFKADDEFKKVDLSDLEVKAGTALDLSFLNANEAPAGKFGRLKVNPDGSAGFEKSSAPFRLQGFTSDLQRLWWTVKDRKTFDENAGRLAEAMRRQGYNFFRMHGIDLWVMEEAEKDLAPTAEYFDRWDRILYEMKKRGIYTQYVIFSFNLYAGKNGWQTHFPRRFSHKLMLYCGRKWERERFRRGAELMLNHRNPYTGLRWKDDPAIVLVEFYNEQSSGFLLHEVKKDPEAYAFFLNCWKEWLKKFLNSSESAGISEETRKKGVASPPDPLRLESQEWKTIFALFRQHLQKTCHEWCAQVLRDIGYRGLFSNAGTPAVNWQTVPVCDSHTYYNHPTKWEAKGSIVKNTSAAAEEAPSIRGVTARRLAGRPFFIGEYNFCYWNPNQRELPLAFNAYAAFQGCSSLAIHDQAVWLGGARNSRLSCFHAGVSPVQRAGEFLSVLFFRRGDVKESPHRVQLRINRNFQRHPVALGKAVSGEQSRVALLAGFALTFPDMPKYPGLPPIPGADWIMTPDGASEIYEEGWFTTVIDSAGRSGLLDRIVRELRRKGILSRQNLTDPSAGIFQTDTGEITLRSRESLIKVVTKRSEAVALRAGAKPERLNAMTVNSVSRDALVGLASVDALSPLADARRMVLVFATENVNTGMILEGDRETMIEAGHAPILLRTAELSIRFRNSNDSLRMYALKLNGTRTEELPLKKEHGEWTAQINTAKLSGGPAVFFEITAEKR